MGIDSVSSSRTLGQDHDSKDRTELNSEEGVGVVANEDGNLSEKQFIRLSEDKVIASASQGASLQGMARRVNGMLAQGQSRETQDWESAEENNGQVATVGNAGDTNGKTRLQYKTIDIVWRINQQLNNWTQYFHRIQRIYQLWNVSNW